jgi:sodium/hydrogen antiporter
MGDPVSASDLAIVARLALPARLERFDVTAPVIFAAAGLVLARGPLAVLGVAAEG